MYALVVPNRSRIRINYAEMAAESSKSDVHAQEIRSVLRFREAARFRECA